MRRPDPQSSVSESREEYIRRCAEYDNPDELTSSVRRSMLLEWTAYVEMLLPRGDKDAASRLSDEEFQSEMRQLKRDYDAGDKGAVPSIIRLCFDATRPVPGWVDNEFCNACWAIYWRQFKSWDDVFERPLKKGAQLIAARRRRSLRSHVGLRVMNRVEAGKPIDKSMFEAIAEELRADPQVPQLSASGKKLKIGGTLVGQVYAECKKFYGTKDWKKEWGADWPLRTSANFKTSRFYDLLFLV
jgi:hypothetical protein